MKKLIKKTVLIFLLSFFFLALNSGFVLSDFISIIQTIFFILITLILLYKPKLKKCFVVVSLICLSIMVVFFTAYLIDVANFFGSLGFGILLISSLFYLPQLLKHGHI